MAACDTPQGRANTKGTVRPPPGLTKDMALSGVRPPPGLTGNTTLGTVSPPPGLTNSNRMDLAPPPGLNLSLAASLQGNCTHHVPTTAAKEQCRRERRSKSACDELSVLAALDARLVASLGARPNQTLNTSSLTNLSEPVKVYPMTLPRTTNLPAPLKVYPSKPPGVFQGPCDTMSSASTSPSEVGEDSDVLPEASSPMHSTESKIVQPADEMCKELSRELQVQPLDMACARPLKVRWPVDAKKLRGRDKQIVSPSFEVSPGCSCKLMLKPKVMGDRRHQEGFQRARGRGSIELKCMEGASTTPALHFWISVGSGSPCGPFTHDFSESSVFGLTKSDESYDFAAAVDSQSSTFLVSLQALPIDFTAQAQASAETDARFGK